MSKPAPVMASFWQFDGSDPEVDADIEGMPARLTVERTDEARVMIQVRGKPRKRYERGDSVWLELADADAVRLIGLLAGGLGRKLR